MRFKIENEYETDLKLLGQIKMSKSWYELHPQPRSTQLPGKTFSPMPNRFKKNVKIVTFWYSLRKSKNFSMILSGIFTK